MTRWIISMPMLAALALAGCAKPEGDAATAPSTVASQADAPAQANAAKPVVTPCVVPKIDGLNYADARKALLDAGWQPVANASTSEGEDSLGEFRKLGMTEVDACAGSGAGECLMKFRNAQGDTLDVVTIGGPAFDANQDGKVAADELPGVRDVTPTCKA